MSRIYFLSCFCLFFITHKSVFANGNGAYYGESGGQSSSSGVPEGYCHYYKSPGCAEAYPGTTPYLWRFIPYQGYRKFSPIGAMYKDWLDYDMYDRHDGRQRRFYQR